MYYYGILYYTNVKSPLKRGGSIMAYLYHWLATMSFSARVIALRKQKGLTQQGLSDASGIHVQQIKRYEAGHARPTADALKKLALALHVTSDALLFEAGEREPDDDLKLRFEAIAAMLPEEQDVAKAVLDAIIVKSQVTGTLERVAKPATKTKAATNKPASKQVKA
jgi:transcriptional regulator with XRE-family HTH domain